jgi:hypothetical protein
MARMISSSPWMVGDVQSHREAMGEGCKLWFSTYIALIWMCFSPTASQRRDATILLTFRDEDGRRRADDGSVLCLKLGADEGAFQ